MTARAQLASIDTLHHRPQIVSRAIAATGNDAAAVAVAAIPATNDRRLVWTTIGSSRSQPALREAPLLGSCCSSLFFLKLDINLHDSSRAAGVHRHPASLPANRMTATTHLGRSGSAGKWPEWAETGGHAMRRRRPNRAESGHLRERGQTGEFDPLNRHSKSEGGGRDGLRGRRPSIHPNSPPYRRRIAARRWVFIPSRQRLFTISVSPFT